MKLLGSAGEDGLEPATYLSGVPKNAQSLTGNDLASLELLLSQAFWKFGRDLSAGHPYQMGPCQRRRGDQLSNLFERRDV